MIHSHLSLIPILILILTPPTTLLLDLTILLNFNVIKYKRLALQFDCLSLCLCVCVGYKIQEVNGKCVFCLITHFVFSFRHSANFGRIKGEK